MAKEDDGSEKSKGGDANGPTYHLDIEGTLHEWSAATITTEKIAELGGWRSADGVLLIDKDQNQRTLSAGEVVELTPGIGFSKKVRFKRGADRVAAEFDLIKKRFPDAELKNGWILLPNYPLPAGWGRSSAPVATRFPPGYPSANPYGMFVPSDLAFQGQPPNNFIAQAGEQPPFPGRWGVLSWQLESWTPSAIVSAGTNFLNWIESFVARFKEGL